MQLLGFLPSLKEGWASSCPGPVLDRRPAWSGSGGRCRRPWPGGCRKKQRSWPAWAGSACSQMPLVQHLSPTRSSSRMSSSSSSWKASLSSLLTRSGSSAMRRRRWRPSSRRRSRRQDRGGPGQPRLWPPPRPWGLCGSWCSAAWAPCRCRPIGTTPSCRRCRGQWTCGGTMHGRAWRCCRSRPGCRWADGGGEAGRNGLTTGGRHAGTVSHSQLHGSGLLLGRQACCHTSVFPLCLLLLQAT